LRGEVLADLDRLEMGEQRRAVIPVHGIARHHHVVALQRRDRDAGDVVEPEAGGKCPVVRLDGPERFLVVAHHVHLVDGEHHAADADERDDETVPPGLGQHAFSGIDEDDGEFRGRGAGRHVAGVLLVARRVGDDELAPVGGEGAIGDVDRDALLALGRQSVDQKREVEVAALGADALGIGFQRGQLVLEQQLRFIQQASDQRRFSVVDAAAGDEPQQILALLLGEIGLDLGGGRRALVQHQK
jgi:hypothetical protein